MHPPDNVYLGFPYPFPGRGQPRAAHQFDAIANHAIYDHATMSAYLRDEVPPHFFTIVREPIDRSVSAFHYFQPSGFPNWDKHLRNIRDTPYKEGAILHYGNSMAFDLGWYEAARFGAHSRDHDASTERIDAFVEHLNATINSIIVLEALDEGLVLFGRAVGLSVVELAYVSMKVGAVYGNSHAKAGHAKVEPMSAQRTELLSTMHVDNAIYECFRARHAHEWAVATAADPSLLDELALLRCLNGQLSAGCDQGVGEQCHRAYQTDSIQYTLKLARQGGFIGFAPAGR